MSTALSRRFGVEIECYHPDGPDGAEYDLAHSPFKRWAEDVDEDGSNTEIRSPILKGYKGLTELRGVMAFLKAKGCSVSKYDGMHVHFEALDYKEDLEALKRLVDAWAANQEVIDKFVSPMRRSVSPPGWAGGRNGYGACMPWDKQQVEAFKRKQRVVEPYMGYQAIGMRNQISNGPRGTLNVIPLTGGRDTIEIRQHEGTLNGEAATAWVRFGMAFLNKVMQEKRAFPTCNNHAQLLKALRLPTRPVRVLDRKVSTVTDNPELDREQEDDEW